MAGAPKKRAAMLAVEAKAEQVKALAEEGKSLRDIERATGLPYQRIHQWCTAAERAEWWKNIRRSRASKAADDAQAVLDGASRDTITVDRERARNLQWMAERLDPEEWGNRPTVAVQVNLAAAFVQALREEKG